MAKWVCPICRNENVHANFLGLVACHNCGFQGQPLSFIMEEDFMETTTTTTLKVSKVQRHKNLCDALNQLYAQKNKDYGDSFHDTYEEEGLAMARIRLSDKLNRFKSLSRSGEQEVKDESMVDTLMDLANYALMTVLEIDETAGQ